jgi:hypothetical protein
MDSQERVLRFAQRFVECFGGVTEREGEALKVLLPSQLAQSLELPEETTFGEGHVPLPLGSPVLDRMVHAATASPPVVFGQISTEYLKKAGFAQILLRDFSFPNSRVTLGQTADTRTTYLLLYAHYTALSDERKEGQVHVTVQEKTGAVVEGFDDNWIWFPCTFFDPDNVPSHFPKDIGSAVQAGLMRAKALALQDLADFIESMHRRLRRDVRHTREYYQALEKEMTAGLNHPTLGEAQKAERLAKIKALPGEAARKIEDLQRKYEIRLTVRPSGAIRLLVGVVQVMGTVQHRQWQRTVSLFWNPVTRAFDPLVCESCGASIHTVYCRAEGGRVVLCCRDCG